ncbi:LacI family DNA-binding transcriptional regulator [Actinoplanes subtropicus]|uniref:LacI family DNA-binding transcriptional regulator n=1 Tax=Actinoplanes subtropicus TaxID=543632 RepID=UPI0004C38129|nr:LacI family DNA-binding transcriptional regulator [Actinoplanes subtropicus]
MAKPAGSPRRQPTLAEVAARAGVSMTAASRVINNAPHVSRAKREAVEKAIRDLGYSPSRTARALATRRNGVIALAISGDDPAIFADPFFAQVIVGISGALEETDLHLVLCLGASGRGRARFQGLLGTHAVDGVMLTALRGDDPLVRLVEESGLPAVYGGRPLHGEPEWFADVDNRGGARTAVEHLIELGRVRIATITGLADTEVGRSRLRGYHDALAAGGLPPYAAEAGDFTVGGGAEAMRALLDTHPDLDAVFVANDNMAAGGLSVLRERGYRVPADVAVVGFDDLEIAGRTDPPLTTVHQPVRALGREMARMLIALLAGQQPTSLILPTRLVVRRSA